MSIDLADWTTLRLPAGVHCRVEAKPPLPAMPGADARAERLRARAHEFAVGRALASALLASVGGVATAVARDEQGAPLWPVGVTGSITHASSLLAVAVARTRQLRAIGIDIEDLSATEHASGIDAVCLNLRETALADACALGPAHARVLFFSAKEALYKCLYPLVRQYFDFLDAEIVDCDAHAGTLVLALTRTLSPAFPAGTRLAASFGFAHHHVMSCVALPPSLKEST